MREPVRPIAEGLARKTSRRGLFGRGADLIFGALIGAAAGTATRPGSAGAHPSPDANTHCVFPGPPCACEHCLSNGVCAKPCIIFTTFYASGCWVAHNGATCCDCDCQGLGGINWCGCGSDYHNNLDLCPDGTA